MTERNHRFFVLTLSLTVIATLFYLFITGISYYRTPIGERFFHLEYNNLKPSGVTGHGLGIIGTTLILAGILSYMLRKRWKRLRRLGVLKYWLEFHIFLCTLGPVMVLYHTSFKFGGIVSLSFWSMIAVFLSGILGRFIYIQIPRTIQGRELSRSEVQALKGNLQQKLTESSQISEQQANIILSTTKRNTWQTEENAISRYLKGWLQDRTTIKKTRKVLLANEQLSGSESREIISLIRHELSLSRRIERLDTMKNLFRYWHVAHLPFAFIMIAIMLVHVLITIALGYKWIF
jgi:hypothetical protein